MKPFFRFFWTLIICLFASVLPQHAQDKSIRFQHITTENGLPQNMVDCILQDSKGFMWFGTWNGLCRFDGYSFKTFRSQDQTISNNFIYALCEDFNGNLWVGTNKGLNIFLYNKNDFFTPEKDSSLNFLSNVAINSIVISKDSCLWISSTRGVSKLKLDKNSKIINSKTIRFGNSNNELSGTKVNHLMIDRSNSLWISTDNGVNILPPNSNHITKKYHDPLNHNGLPLNKVICTFEDSERVIWLGTEMGVSIYDRDKNTFKNFLHNADDEYSLVHNSVMSITEDSKGRIIIGTLGGISIFKKDGSLRFSNYTQNPVSESELNNNFINCLYADHWGNIWVGTERGGINKFNSTKREFEYFERKSEIENTLSNNTINSIYEDKNYIWIGTAGGGLNQYSKRTGTYKHYTLSENKTGTISSNFITAITRDNNNTLWVGTWGGGINKLVNEDKINEQFVYYRPGSKQSIINDYVSSIVPDNKGNLWIGTNGGLDVYSLEKEIFSHINEMANNSDMLSSIGCMLEDNENNWWIGTQYGLIKLEPQFANNEIINLKLKKYTFNENDPTSLSGNYITTLCKDSEGNIWIGTYGHGLNKLISDKNEGSFISFSQKDGLPNNIIYTITEDISGNLWLTTDYGLSRYNKTDKVFRNYFIADGLQNNQYYWSAAFINKTGKLYFGGMNGLNTFYPDWLKENKTEISVVFTDFTIFNQTVIPGEKYNGKIALTKSINNTDQIRLSHKTREFSLEFSALDYEQPLANQYAYMLEGFDKEWNIVSSERRFANYTNLKPGKYTFLVKATNSHGKWSEQTRKLNVIITPPFWDTWWFKLLMIIAVIASIISYNRYRVYALQTQKRKLEKQVHERTLEIEDQKQILEKKNDQLANRQELIEGQKKKLESQNDKLIDLNKRVKQINQLKLRFFTNISHEFRTPLTLILAPLEKLKSSSNNFDEETQKSISIIHRNSQRLLNLINQLMDFRKLEQGKMKLQVSEVNLNEFITNIIESFGALADKLKITLSLLTDEEIPVAWLDHRKIENVLYNLLSNAIKHTPANGKIYVRIKKSDINNSDFPGTMQSDHLIIEVSDTGYGMDEESLLHIFDRFYQIDSDTASGRPIGTGIGLSLAKEFIKLHRGKIRVISKVGEGTSFFVHIPYKQEQYPTSEQGRQRYNPNAIKQQTSILADNMSATSPKEKIEHKKVKGRPIIQITEDNNDLREFLANKLKDKYNIIEAENGRVGYELATINNPDIIISDIMMPEMDGLEMCTKIKTNLVTSHIPVILLTAKGTIENQIEGLETGAEIYLPKPFDLELLNAHISNLIDSRKKLYEHFLVKDKIDTEEITNSSLDDKFMNSLLRIININLENPELNVNMLLKELSISRSLLHRKITTLTNMSTVEFITNIRLKKSAEMLHDSSNNISEVAYAVGFNDPKYFSRIFKKQFGKSPSEYQKSLLTI